MFKKTFISISLILLVTQVSAQQVHDAVAAANAAIANVARAAQLAEEKLATLELVQQTKAALDTLAEAKKLYDTAKSTLETTKSTLDSLKGNKGFGDILDTLSDISTIPDDWAKFDSNSLSDDAKKVMKQYGVLDACKNVTAEAKKSCEDASAIDAIKYAQGEKIMKTIDKRMDNLEELRKKIASATDAKSIAELQARIAIEASQIENDKQRMDAFNKKSESHNEMLAKKANQDIFNSVFLPTK